MSNLEPPPVPSELTETSALPAFEEGRAREFYGFVALVSTAVLFVMYVGWALLPDDVLVSIGVEWFPNREWAILVPAWTVVLVLLTYASYFALALSNTPSLSDLSCITDEHALLPQLREGETSPFARFTDPDAIPELYDFPIGLVNRVLYRTPCSHSEQSSSEALL